MGFFGNLFEKKECAICGEKVGLIGNRKLEDGNMCKECTKKLSPWFDDRRHTCVEDIKAQLAYRASNQENLKQFHPAKSIGEYYKFFVEYQDNVPTRFVVSKEDDFIAENADIVNLRTDVASFKIDVDESYTELKRKDENGQMVSYFPARYEFRYNFYCEFVLNESCFFDKIRFKLNRNTVYVQSEMQNRGFGSDSIFIAKNIDPSFNPEWRHFRMMCDEIELIVNEGMMGVRIDTGSPAARPVSVSAEPEAQPASKPKFCSSCGAPASDGKFCQNCGAPLN